jgi:hypothetical protein
VKAVRRSEAKPPEVASLLDLPETILGNPFSHPRLAEGPTPQMPSTEELGEIQPLNPERDGFNIRRIIGSIPGVGAPEQTTGANRKQSGDIPPLTLSAVVEAGQPVAFISAGDEESMPYKVGEIIVPGARLVSIKADYVVVRTAKGQIRLPLGGDE